ncbi:MAG: amidohydrolase family protein [Fimbriimonadales bacterium]
MDRLLRPYGVVIDGILELGIELVLSDGVIQGVRPHTGIPELFVVSPAFVNAHSHLEYRGLQGKLRSTEYWRWIREITEAKREQNLDDVQTDCMRAADENAICGVAAIAEHSDRPYAGEALGTAGLPGVIFQEVITRFEPESRAERLANARDRSARQKFDANVYSVRTEGYLAPHAYQTVDEETLRWFGSSGLPFSMHVAESDLENQLTLSGTGAIGDTFRELGVGYQATGKRLIPSLDELGLVTAMAQFVHCCAIDSEETGLLASRGVNVAHCPRSNANLGCPTAPVREMLDAGINVGLGLDSAASSGPIDVFDEMRCALRVSLERGRPVTPKEVWNMATGMGAESLRFAIGDLTDWRIRAGSAVPLIMIHIPDALTTDEVIERGRPELVEWAL